MQNKLNIAYIVMVKFWPELPTSRVMVNDTNTHTCTTIHLDL